MYVDVIVVVCASINAAMDEGLYNSPLVCMQVCLCVRACVHVRTCMFIT